MSKQTNKDQWLRCRFHANEEDYRPVKWPPPGPYWLTGQGDDYSIIVAYVRFAHQIKEFWPEATQVDIMDTGPITYSDRFAKPEWYK